VLHSLAADLVVLLHFAFILFVIGGALLVARHPWLAAVHLPAVAWAVLLELRGWICPLTPLENTLRQAAGKAGYEGGFVEQYLLPVLYPAGLDATMQWIIGSFVIVINVALYGWILITKFRHKQGTQ
jgi:hypothetical protein